MNYIYPDPSDFITLSLVLMKKADDQLLKKADDDILAHAVALFQDNRYDSLLDLGCGNGRLSIEFSKYFKWITALEPDRERLALAKNNLMDHPIENVSFVHSLFQDAGFPDQNFDVVICHQVLQHVQTPSLEPIVRDIHRVLKTKGKFVLTTSYVKGDKDCYRKAFAADGKVKSVKITQKKFDGLASGDPGILPIHYFSSKSLANLLSSFRRIEQSIHDKVYPHPLLDTILFIGEKMEK
jgi:ubiquinone/menaquinone biosynthesis C-methylase UbiE